MNILCSPNTSHKNKTPAL